VVNIHYLKKEISPKYFHFVGDIYRMEELMNSQDFEGYTGNTAAIGRVFFARVFGRVFTKVKN